MAALRRFGLTPADIEEVTLPAEQRVAVLLRDFAGVSTTEAAAATGAARGAFKSRLHRGRMLLRALLEPYLGPGQP
jgi:DNA-directed RNA polymerase specialized sigma24 family protein